LVASSKYPYSLKLQENTAKRQLRAYICMDTAEVRMNVGQPVAIINFKNCGQTPAHEVQGWIGVQIAAHPLGVVLPKPTDPDTIFPKETVGAGGISQFMRQRGIPLSEEERQGLFSPQYTLYAYGQLRYKDVFGDQWYTNFRFIAGGPEGVTKTRLDNGKRSYILSPDMEGNDAT
jgi:hypothetical protein